MKAVVRIACVDPTPMEFPLPPGGSKELTDRWKAFCTSQFLRERCRTIVTYWDDNVPLPEAAQERSALIAKLLEDEEAEQAQQADTSPKTTPSPEKEEPE